MRDFETPCAKFAGKLDELADLIEIGAMDDGVDGERQAGSGHVAGEGALALPCAGVVAETVVGLLVRALEGELCVVEAGVDEFAGQLLAHPDPRGDEVGVEPALRGVAREVGNIAPRPLLLIHAANDSVTPTEQSIEMFKRAGQPTELHLFSGLDHFLFAENSTRVWSVLRGWLDKYFPVTRP